VNLTEKDSGRRGHGLVSTRNLSSGGKLEKRKEEGGKVMRKKGKKTNIFVRKEKGQNLPKNRNSPCFWLPNGGEKIRGFRLASAAKKLYWEGEGTTQGAPVVREDWNKRETAEVRE